MTLNEFFVKLFGSKESSAEFEHLEHWQQEGLDNASILQELIALSEDSFELHDYKSFDVEDAFAKNMETLEEELPLKKGNVGRSVLIIFAVLTLILGALYFLKPDNSEAKMQFAETPGLIKIENGSEITLNENSNYSYDSAKNLLKLKGEAYFDVTSQKTPFVIETEHGIITVLGTSFNVKTDQEKTSIYVYEGKIKVEYLDDTFYLTKGEYASIDDVFSKIKEENEQVISYWRSKHLEYKNVPLNNVLADINRLYNKQLSAKTGNPKVTSSFENNSLEEIIRILETITGVEIK